MILGAISFLILNNSQARVLKFRQRYHVLEV